jgi:hypothetical protein
MGYQVPATGTLGPSTPEEREKADRVGWAVPVAARRFPVQMTCLVQALAADTLLRRRGCHPLLRIGVSGGKESPTIEAHAWVECGGRVVVGDVGDLPRYAVLSSPGTR